MDVYLDHNATAPIDPEVAQAMEPFLRRGHGNPSCGHKLGRAARTAVEEARREVSEFLGCATDEIVFTSGGTEANNWAIKGAALARAEQGKHILVGAAEHPSVGAAARWLGRFGFEVDEVPVDEQGQVQPSVLARALRPDTVLVSLMTAQNSVGTVNRIEELAEVVRGRKVLFHTDAAQAVGKIPCAFPFLGPDLMTVAGHKLYGPTGVGALIIKRGRTIEPLFHGAGHEAGRRSGTENVAAIVGFGAAIGLARRRMAEDGERIVALRDLLHLRLTEALPGVVLNGHPLDRLPNTLNLSFLGVSGARIAERVPDLMLATGPACHDRAVQVVSPTFAAMGLGPERSSSSLRLSLGRKNTLEEVEHAAERIAAAVADLRAEAGKLPAAAREPSVGPLCPRCESGLAANLDHTPPIVVCRHHPECRHEVCLLPLPALT